MSWIEIEGVVGVVVTLGFTVHALKTGRARFEYWVDYRARNPVNFWMSIVLYLMLAGAFVMMASGQISK